MARQGDNPFPSAQFGLLAVVLSLPVLIAFAALGEFGRGMTAWICTAMVVGIVKTHWNFRTQIWFWSTIAALAALQIPFVVFFPIPMTGSFTVWSLLPAAVLDFVIMYKCVQLVAKTMKKT